MNNKNNSSGGIGIAGILTLIFIVLKLIGVITWSWLWVFSPIWIDIILAIFIIFIVWTASLVK